MHEGSEPRDSVLAERGAEESGMEVDGVPLLGEE
jgi:hypothetical protein